MDPHSPQQLFEYTSQVPSSVNACNSGVPAAVSQPASESGSPFRHHGLLPASVPSPASFADEAEAAIPGIMIDLELALDSPGSSGAPSLREQSTPRLISERELPPIPTADDVFPDSALNAAGTTQDALEETVQPFTLSDVKRDKTLRCYARRLSDEERKQFSSEQDRLRADEVIRVHVMKQLQAEQQGLLKPPVSRTPRRAVTPPLAPPPPFAPPPVPPSPSGSVASCRPSTSSKSLRSIYEAAQAQRGSSSRRKKSGTVGAVMQRPQQRPPNSPSRGARQAPSPRPLEARPRTSEAQESIRSSTQSSQLWEYAEAASARNSFLSVYSQSSYVSHADSHRKTRLSSAAVSSPGRTPGSQASYKEPSKSNEHEGADLSCAASSSQGSVGASSIFDKELPTPPLSDGEDSTAGAGSSDWLSRVPASWSETRSSSMVVGMSHGASSLEEAEMRGLRERLTQTMIPAGSAESSIRVVDREERIGTLRLSSIETGSQDQAMAEAVRRAKWAREQVARNQLDAYERSKLEVDEKRRRRAVEQQRLLDRERAVRRREEQEWREQQAERLGREHEIQRRVLAERIAKLRAEAEAKEQLERERKAKQAARESYRQGRLLELTNALQKEREMDAEVRPSPTLKGWLNLQLEGEVRWKRRWYVVTGRQLILSRSATDRSLATTIPLDPKRLISVSDQHEDGTMDCTLVLEVQQGPSDDCTSSLASEPGARRCYTIHLDTREAKEEMGLVIEAIASL